MAVNKNKLKYVSGTYAQKRPDVAQLAEAHIQDWVKTRLKIKPTTIELGQIQPVICFSRKIGVGALEIADRLAEKLNYRVADRVLLDYMAKNKKLSKQTIDFIDNPLTAAEIVTTKAYCEKYAAELIRKKSFIYYADRKNQEARA